VKRAVNLKSLLGGCKCVEMVELELAISVSGYSACL